MNELSLHTKNRQAPAAILFILLRFLKRSGRTLWPILLIWLFNPGKETNSYLVWFVLAFSLLQLANSLLSYFRYTYYARDGEFIIEKGVLRRTRLGIPFDRIQSINYEQNVLHQAFGVVSVKIDTAGSAGKEETIDALSLPLADELKAFIIREKGQMEPANDSTSDASSGIPLVESEAEAIFKLTPADLLRVGLSENHLRAAGIIIGALFALYQTVDNVIEFDPETVFENATGWVLRSSWLIFLIGGLGFAIIAFLFSLVRTVLTYFDLTVFKTGHGLRIISGLFTKREQLAQRRKIQLLSWRTDPLKQIFSLFTFRLFQASSVSVRRKNTLTIPGCYQEQVEKLITLHIPKEFRMEWTTHGIHPYAIFRRTLYIGGIPSFAMVVLGFIPFFNGGEINLFWLILSIVWMVATYFLNRRYHRKWQYRINADILETRSGTIGTRWAMIEMYKLQAVRLVRSIYHRRRGLANLVLHTATGSVVIPYLELDKAMELYNYLVYRVEVDGRNWM